MLINVNMKSVVYLQRQDKLRNSRTILGHGRENRANGRAHGHRLRNLPRFGFSMLDSFVPAIPDAEGSGAHQSPPGPRFGFDLAVIRRGRAGFGSPRVGEGLARVAGRSPHADERGAPLRGARDEKKSPSHDSLLPACVHTGTDECVCEERREQANPRPRAPRRREFRFQEGWVEPQMGLAHSPNVLVVRGEEQGDQRRLVGPDCLTAQGSLRASRRLEGGVCIFQCHRGAAGNSEG